MVQAKQRYSVLSSGITAIVVILQILVVQALALSGELHQSCHDHSHEPAHECAITLFAHSGCDKVNPDIVPVYSQALTPTAPLGLPVAIEAEPTHLVGGVLAHAPPRGP